MPPPISGLHHVTAIAGDPALNRRFYADELGLRLVKRTVNFDDPSTYHLYYGDAIGTPGTAMTFFPFPQTPPGSIGTGQVAATAFAIPPGSLEAWEDRLGAAVVGVDDRFGETVLRVRDPDGLALELVERDVTGVDAWTGSVASEHAIRGFDGVSVASTDPESTGDVLDLLGFERSAVEPGRQRYAGAGERARHVDLVLGDRPRGRPGTGTVHHVAFRVPDRDAQAAWREAIIAAGHRVTPVRDRLYFRSIYFREPGGVLFELATDGPGFAIDEPTASLGETLQLPPWLEEDRDAISGSLPPLTAEAEP